MKIELIWMSLFELLSLGIAWDTKIFSTFWEHHTRTTITIGPIKLTDLLYPPHSMHLQTRTQSNLQSSNIDIDEKMANKTNVSGIGQRISFVRLIRHSGFGSTFILGFCINSVCSIRFGDSGCPIRPLSVQ